MVVKIQLGAGPKVRQNTRKNRHLALALAALLTPAAVMAFVLAFWRLAADLKATGAFPISDGLFSHWQVWLVGAVMLQSCAMGLNRYGHPQVAIQKPADPAERELVNSGL
jgi:hypothetical protein